MAIALRQDGGLYVAEATPARVTSYDENGKFLRVMMRSGEGPGETLGPEINVQGDTLLTYDPRLARLTRMSPQGKVLDERSIDAKTEGHVGSASGGRILLDMDVSSPEDGEAIVIGLTGRVDTLFWHHPHSDDLAIQWNGPNWHVRGISPFSPWAVVTADPQGRIVIGGSRYSRWYVIDHRDTVATVTLPERHIPIAKRVRDSVWAAFLAQLIPRRAQLPHLDDVVREDRIPTTLPPWLTLNIDDAGEWWLGRPASDGTLGSWDVLIGGRIAATLARPARIVRTFFGPVMALGSRTTALLHEDSHDEPWIGLYAVERTK